jgi:hypothetical protein
MMMVFMKRNSKLYAIGVNEKEEYKILEINHTKERRRREKGLKLDFVSFCDLCFGKLNI